MKQVDRLGVGWGRWTRLEPALDDMGNEHGFCDLCDAPIGWQHNGERYVAGWYRRNPDTGTELFACRLCALEATVLMLDGTDWESTTVRDVVDQVIDENLEGEL